MYLVFFERELRKALYDLYTQTWSRWAIQGGKDFDHS